MPRALRGVNLDQLKCTYRHSKKAWMNHFLFTRFLEWFNLRVRSFNGGRKVVLLIDGAGCHGNEEQYSYLADDG